MWIENYYTRGGRGVLLPYLAMGMAPELEGGSGERRRTCLRRGKGSGYQGGA